MGRSVFSIFDFFGFAFVCVLSLVEQLSAPGSTSIKLSPVDRGPLNLKLKEPCNSVAGAYPVKISSRVVGSIDGTVPCHVILTSPPVNSFIESSWHFRHPHSLVIIKCLLKTFCPKLSVCISFSR